MLNCIIVYIVFITENKMGIHNLKIHLRSVLCHHNSKLKRAMQCLFAHQRIPHFQSCYFVLPLADLRKAVI